MKQLENISVAKAISHFHHAKSKKKIGILALVNVTFSSFIQYNQHKIFGFILLQLLFYLLRDIYWCKRILRIIHAYQITYVRSSVCHNPLSTPL
jgi:hypothetical protein